MNTINRRELLRDGARALLCAGFLVTGAILGTRERSGREASCLLDLPCRQCGKYDGCRDPRVTRYRRQQNRAATVRERRRSPLPDGRGSEPSATTPGGGRDES
jgi:hypothetical protein